MGELESIREIARRLVAEYRAKKTIPTVQEKFVNEPSCTEKKMNVAVAESIFDGLDREMLRSMGIEC